MQIDDDILIFLCPHCIANIIIAKNEINCGIFRHGVYKIDNKQIDPHLSKQECDRLYNTNSIYGCGKPFKLVNNAQWTIEKCDYI